MLRKNLCSLFCAKDSGMEYGGDLNVFVRRPTAHSIDFLASQASQRPCRVDSFRDRLTVPDKINVHDKRRSRCFFKRILEVRL